MEKQSTRKFLKLIVALVAFFLLGASALLFASCNNEHEHAWADEPVESVPPTCTSNGSNTFTCTVEGCTETNVVVVPALGHDYQLDSAQSSDPTCTQNGQDVYRCSRCDDTYSVTKPATGHDLGEPVTVEATCSKAGSITRVCQNEGCDYEEVTILPATGAHTRGEEPDADLSVAPTCASAGTNVYTCVDCGAVVATVTVPATGVHTWDDGVVYEASCESQGYTHYTCEVCGLTDDTDYTNKLGHYYYKEDGSLNYVNEIQATCTTAGSRQIACIRCGVRYADENYANAHPALGHIFSPNTSADDTLKGITDAIFSNKEIEGYVDVAAAKLDGWTTVTEQKCEEGGSYQRTCSRCGEYTETAVSEGTGHSGASTIKACYIDKTLVDADGNAKYSYECENPNCDSEPVTGKDGEQHHWIAATAAHTWGEWVVAPAATCITDGKQTRTCSVCNTVETETITKTGHKWNTLQMDGKTEVVVCEGDPLLTEIAYLNAMFKSLGAEEYANQKDKLSKAYNDALKESEGRGVSRFCSVCGEIEAATGHNYIVSKLKDGKYGLDDYEVDETTGLPKDSGVSVADMDCRYVQVCANGCGRVLARGQHGVTTAATCRNPETCTVCKEPLSQLLDHVYMSVADIIKNGTAANAKADAIALYNAYIAVSATETWMKEVVGSCDTPSTTVQLCVNCLLAAAEGEETVTWNKSETKLTASNPIYNASVVDVPAMHSYVAHYYRLTATSLEAGEIVYDQTNCNVGYKIAYICEDCDDVYRNVPVGNSTADPDAAEANTATTNPNYIYELGYTDSLGFVLDITNPEDSAGAKYEMDKITADQVAQLQAEDNIGAHSLYVIPEYQKTNGYLASTCATLAEIPYVCEKCGATVVLNASVTSDAGLTIDFRFATDADGSKGYGTILDADKAYNPENHAAEAFACGEHCKAVDKNGNYICAALVAAWKALNPSVNKTDYVLKDDAFVDDTAHASVTIEYGFTTSVKYFKDYTIMIATVPEAGIKDEGKTVDFTKATLSATTKVTLCLDDSTYKLPLTVKVSDNTKGDYLVLVKDGKVYGVKDYNLYTQDDGKQSGELTTDTKVTQDDKFFVGFDAENSTATDAPITAVDEASLTTAFNGTPVTVGTGTEAKKVLTVNVGADISVNAMPAFNKDATEVVVNLNGHKLTSASQYTVSGNVTFSNGSMEVNGATGTTSSFIADVNCDVNFDKINFKGNGILLNTTGYKGEGTASAKISFTNSTIVSTGVYGIGTNATDADEEQPEVGLELINTTVTMNPDNGTTTAATDNVAVFINVPSTVKISGCTLSANRQVIVVRGGNVTIENTTINMKGEFDQYEVVQSGADNVNSYNFSSLGNTAISTINAYDANYTLQDYRMSGLWSSGNELPSAAMVIGHSGVGTSYQYKSTVTLGEGVVFNIDNPEAPAVVIGSYYDAATIGEGETMVSLTADASIGLSTENVKVCWNWMKDTIAFKGVTGYPAKY